MQTRNRRTLSSAVILWSFLSIVIPCFPGGRSPIAQDTDAITKTLSGVIVKTPNDTVRVEVCNESVLRVTAAPRSDSILHTSATPWAASECNTSSFSLARKENAAILTTPSIQVSISLENGELNFSDGNGMNLLREQGRRSYEPLPGLSQATYRVADNFLLVEDEAIYGLGQHQSGALNNRGSSVYLSQRNTDVAVPVFLSTRGYGMIWNTASSTLWDNRLAHLLTLTTEAATTIDYYFIYGPEPDQIIHQYRELTGHAPMFGKWAYGLLQSKDRYESQSDLLNVVNEYRSRHIPLDTIVQDYFWWTKQGSSQFNSNYPAFPDAIDKLHQERAHVMISIWPDFDTDTPISREMTERNWLIFGTQVYDATNPQARDLYWKDLAGPLLDRGIDAFWLDASEPEQPGEVQRILPGSHIYLGDSALYTNVYPTLHAEGIYDHWRNSNNQKRAFILSRSAFLGSQKSAAATWSGDVYSNFWSLSRQVPAGLNFVMSGVPYWTTDIGGYGYPDFKSTEDPAFRELFTRWFEYSTFCPLLRIHGHRVDNRNEIYDFGPDTPILIQYDKLRYRMLPYIYSLAWKVTNQDYTMMRPLVMDWRNDRDVWEVGDEFMFGPALLVAPVTKQQAVGRSVYLPHAPAWYDFWTGKRVLEGQIQSDAPLNRIPVYVRAGAILPLGPEVEYADQKPADPIELRIYQGADGMFDLYDDNGDGYEYEQGERAVIPIRWDDTSKTLTIGRRSGSYPEMPKVIRFNVIFVGPDHGSGNEISAQEDKQVVYFGQAVQVVK